jgi:hypothetical protein
MPHCGRSLEPSGTAIEGGKRLSMRGGISPTPDRWCIRFATIRPRYGKATRAAPDAADLSPAPAPVPRRRHGRDARMLCQSRGDALLKHTGPHETDRDRARRAQVYRLHPVLQSVLGRWRMPGPIAAWAWSTIMMVTSAISAGDRLHHQSRTPPAGHRHRSGLGDA